MKLLLLLVLLPVVFAAVPNKTDSADNAVVVQPVANMYSRASTDADVVSQAIFSTNVAVLEQDGAWLKIRTPDAYTGWVQANVTVRSKPYADTGSVVQVEALFANLYRETNITKHQPVITIPFESRLEVIGEPEAGGRWFQVRLPDDRTAWVQAGDVTSAPRHDMSVAELIDWSKRFVGLPYLWGGTSTYGYDCSGFMQMLCRRRGFSLPRDAQPQAEWSGVAPVEKSELRPGDLLYFGSSPKHITHTGMYVGNGLFINATAHQHPMVQVDNLNEEHWTKLLVAARRIKQ